MENSDNKGSKRLQSALSKSNIWIPTDHDKAESESKWPNLFHVIALFDP